MSKLVGRGGLFACLLVAILGLFSWCFASPLGQAVPKSAGEKAQAAPEAKTSKKKKKKKAAPAFLVLAPMQNQIVSPAQLRKIEVNGNALLIIQPKVAAIPRVVIRPAVDPQPLGAVGTLIISEFRVRGPNGANDEFVELHNPNVTPLTVTVSDASTGWAVAASDGTTRFVIPTGTIIPPKGHYLGVNGPTAFSLSGVGYSLSGYANGDAGWTTDIPDNAGIALFNTSIPANFSLATRLDAVGSTSEANTLYKEGTGYPALTPFSIDYSFYRDSCGKSGSITTFGPCPAGSSVKDTNNNAADFIFVDTNGTSAGAGQRLGAPGPENLGSPIENNAAVTATLLDPCVGGPSSPNLVRDFTSDPANNSTFGTLDIRRTFTNNTGANITRLRFRVVDITTFPAPSGVADLRPRISTSAVVNVDRPPCGSGTSNVTVEGTTLEQPPSQPNGGGFNSSLSAGTVTLATPLANGASIDVRFLLGIQQTGSFKFYINAEALNAPPP